MEIKLEKDKLALYRNKLPIPPEYTVRMVKITARMGNDGYRLSFNRYMGKETAKQIMCRGQYSKWDNRVMKDELNKIQHEYGGSPTYMTFYVWCRAEDMQEMGIKITEQMYKSMQELMHDSIRSFGTVSKFLADAKTYGLKTDYEDSGFYMEHDKEE